jgi:hypothetical protein
MGMGPTTPSCKKQFCSEILHPATDKWSMLETDQAKDKEQLYRDGNLECTHIAAAGKDAGKYVRFEVFTAVTTKNSVFWVVTPCGSCKNRRFGGT